MPVDNQNLMQLIMTLMQQMSPAQPQPSAMVGGSSMAFPSNMSAFVPLWSAILNSIINRQPTQGYGQATPINPPAPPAPVPTPQAVQQLPPAFTDPGREPGARN